MFPPPASVMLPRRVGQGHADDIALTGRSVDAVEAERIGLVNLLTAEGQDAREVADQWIEKHILPKSPSSLRIANQAVRMDFFRRLRKDLPKMESLYLEKLMESCDANEGIAAFLEKRKPAWKGE